MVLILGFLIYSNPQKAFEIQKKFYAMINWRIEPIDFEKEMRNTRWMGLFLIIFVVMSCLYYIIQK